MNDSEWEAAALAMSRFFAEQQWPVVDCLSVLSVTAASCMLNLPPDQQDALLRGFNRAVSQNLTSMQARLDRATAGEGQQ